MAVQEGLRRLPRIGLDEPDVGMGQDQAEEGNLLPPAPDLHHRLAEVDLGMARRVMQRHKSLARRLPPSPDIVLHDGIAAGGTRARPVAARISGAPCGAACAARPDPVRQANWQKVGGASPPERRSNQTTFLREPCVGSREGAGEASAAVRMGGAIEHRKSDGPGCRGFQIGRRQHRRHRFGEMSANPAVSENPCTFARLLLGPWEVFKLPLLS